MGEGYGGKIVVRRVSSLEAAEYKLLTMVTGLDSQECVVSKYHLIKPFSLFHL